MWSPIGTRPVAHNCTRYQWIYAYSFVHPRDGRTSWLLLPTVNTALMDIALQTFEREANPKRNKIIILLIDQAGFHTAKNLKIPSSIKFLPIPAHTPELQPTECIWPLLKEAVANQTFPSLDALEEKLISRCRWLIENTDIVQKVVGFSWISYALNQENSS